MLPPEHALRPFLYYDYCRIMCRMTDKVSNPFSVSNHQPLRFLGDEYLELERYIGSINDNYLELMFGHEGNIHLLWFKEVGVVNFKVFVGKMILEWAKAKDYYLRYGKLPDIPPVGNQREMEHYK